MNLKKIFKYFSFLFVMLFGLIGISDVKAQTYSGNIINGPYVGGPYYIMHTKGNSNMWFQGRFILRNTDGHFVYCVQPFVEIKEDATYDVSTEDIAQTLSMSKDTWNQIARVAYYGYGYKDSNYDHTDDRYYLATQMIIWKLADPSVDSYFTNTLKGPRNDFILANEMNEIKELANRHKVIPNLVNFPNEMTIGQTITVNDANNILSNYQINNVNNGTVTKNGNNLSITATGVGKLSFSLQRLGNRYGNPVELYYAIDSQNVIRRGDIDPITISKNITVYGGKVEINKTDNDTFEQKPQGEASLGGAVYGIYKEDNTRVGSITTDLNGNAISDYLPSLGRFYVLEEKASTGYELDKNKYYFEVTSNDLNPKVQVFEKVIKRTFDFTKVYADDKTGIMTPEVGVQFGIFNNKNELVNKFTTDSQGNFKTTLPYGTYTVKQLTSTKGYEKANDFIIKVKTSGEVVKKVIANAEITAKLKVIKIDKDTGDIIERAGIKFKIFNVKTNKYVSQTITYPTVKTYDVFETDASGVLITLYPLESGTYYLEEVDQKLDGYLWNDKSVEFTIDENSKLINDEVAGILTEVKFENKEVKGKVNIHKNGEVVEFTDNGYVYSKTDLEGVKIGLYANEKIYSANGVLKYSKNDKIGEYITDKDGNITITNLYLGSYYIQEIETVGNHVLDENKYDFKLEYKDQYTEIIEYSKELNNYLSKGKLEFTKTDFFTSEAIPNTKIKIYMYNDQEEKLIGEYVTDKNGKVIIDDLPSNQKYYIIETEASESYVQNEEKMYFEIKENGEVIKSIMTNEKIKSTLKIHKVDENENPLSGVVIGIFDLENNLIGEYTTNENGDIEVELEYGSYYFKEVSTIDGYKLTDEKIYFDITEDGEYIQHKLVNEAIIVEVPNTNKDELPIIPITVICSLLGLGLIIYGKKKN